MSVPWKYRVPLSEVVKIDFGDLEVSANELAGVFSKYIIFGSKRYVLTRDELEVYANPERWYVDKEFKDVTKVGEEYVANTLRGLMATGTKFLDAIFYLGLDESDRPRPLIHQFPETATPKGKEKDAEESTYNDPEDDDDEITKKHKMMEKITLTTYNDHAKIARCMFIYYFYLLTRAAPPNAESGAADQPIPNFIKSVLGYSENPAEIQDYLASFSLSQVNNRWVRHIDVHTLSTEALNRFGLGVAGYRMAGPFKLMIPGRDEAIVKKYDGPIAVAKSIAESPASWDIHPATRSANILQKYGNLNKNLANLILKVYTDEQIEILVKNRILYEKPTENPAYTNFETWSLADVFVPGSRIFNE